MTTATHDGYVAVLVLEEDARAFHGEVIDTRDLPTCRGPTPDELRSSFADTIARYIGWRAGRSTTRERAA